MTDDLVPGVAVYPMSKFWPLSQYVGALVALAVWLWLRHEG